MTALAGSLSWTRARRALLGRRGLSRAAVNLGVLLLMAIWLIPTIGLLVNSFRPVEEVTRTGWWTVLFAPTELTMDNYVHVLTRGNLSVGFINMSLIHI